MKLASREIRIAPFIIGIVSFLLPFLDITCSGEKIRSFTGIQLVTGAEMKPGLDGTVQNIPPEPFAIIALLMFICGAFFAYKTSLKVEKQVIAFSIAAFVSILVLKMRVDGQIAESAKGAPIFAEYKSGYWIACLAALASAGMALYRQKVIDQEKVG